MADTWTAISGYTPQDYTDTAVFEVNSDTKKIALITGQALVAGEENSQYIKFVLDRYWDGIDIKDKAFYVEYALAGQYYGKTAAVNAEYNTEQVRFGWIVPKEACCISGTLLFVLRIESTDYVLKTQIAEHPVYKSVNVEDVVPEPTKEAWYREFEARVETAIGDAEAALTAAQAAQASAENAALNAQTSEENAETAAATAQTRYGSPLTAAEADEMIEQNRVYVYVGSETGYTYGHWYYYNGTEWADGGAYNGSAVNTDTTLTQSGMAADAKATGDEISQIKEDLSDIQTATAEDVGKALKVKTVTDGKVTEWEFGSTGSGSGLTQSQKLAILNCFAHVAWTDAQGQTYYDELEDVLFPPAELTSISAVYVNSNPVYTDTDIDTLKQYITVTAHYSDGTSSAVNAYTLSGTLTVGTSVLTVAYSEMTTTISVTVSATPKSDMNGWADGVMYTDIEVIENSYYNGIGNPQNYNNWDRTGKIPCDGASTLVFKANGNGDVDKTYCWFFAQDETPLQKFDAPPLRDSDVSVSVPTNAYYFGISGTRSQIAAQLTQGIYPYA